MKKVIKTFGGLIFIAFIAVIAMISPTVKGATTQVSLTVDSWQGSYPYEWVNQTQSSPGFTPEQVYAGFFSGMVDGQRWLFMCTEMNQAIYIGQTYSSFTMNSGVDYINTPFESNGSPLVGTQKEEVAGLLSLLVPGQAAGFTCPGVQSLIGVEMTPEVTVAA